MSGVGSDYHLSGVFSTVEKAREYARAQQIPEGIEIHEQEVVGLCESPIEAAIRFRELMLNRPRAAAAGGLFAKLLAEGKIR